MTGFAGGTWQDLQAGLDLAEVNVRVALASDDAVQAAEESDDVPAALLLALRDPRLQVSSDGSLWQADLELAVEQVAVGEADAGSPLFPRSSLAGALRMDDEENLGGELRLDFPSLAWLQALVPALEAPLGQASGNVSITGTRSEPGFDADLRLAGVSFRVPELGLDIQSLEAVLNATPEQASLNADVRDAQGTLHLEAGMSEPLADTRALQATLQGERFTLMNNEAAQVEISPDLQLSWSAAGLQVGGRSLVPLATIIRD